MVETTLSGNTYLKMMSRAKAAGYRVQLLYVGTENVDINLQRVRQRVRKGGHDVPEEDQRRRYPRSLANLERALALADEAILFDNSTSRGHVRIAEKRVDGITLFGTTPNWASFMHALAKR